jgi:hypothetical protein
MSKALDLAKFGRETAPTGLVVGDSDTQTLSAKTFSDMPVLSAGTVNGVVYLSGSKALATSSNLIFNGTLLTVSDIRDSSLTAGRITYAGVGGNLVDSANLVFDGTNLGVGTSSPITKLGVVGNAIFSGSTPFISLAYNQAGSTPCYWELGADGVATLHNIGNGSNNGVWRFIGGGGSEFMRLNSSGNLGIGTSSPASILTVYKVTAASSPIGSTANSALRLQTDASEFNEKAEIQFQAGTVAANTGEVIAAISSLYTVYNNPNDGGGALLFSTRQSAATGGLLERMRIDSSGNVGIGVTNQTSRFDVLATTDAISANLRGRSSDNISVLRFATAANVETAAIDIRPSEGMIFAFGSGRTERARIDSSGNFLLGTTSAISTFTVRPPEGQGIALQRPGSSGTHLLISTNAGNASPIFTTTYSTSNCDMRFSTAQAGGTGGTISFLTGTSGTATERARIDSSGNFLLGTTSATAGQMVVTNQSATYAINVAAVNNAGTFYQIYFSAGVGGTTVGSIASSASSTTYATSSDYRLKNTVAPITGALAKVAQLKPVTYKWNVDGSDGEGFIAHELAEVCPNAVLGAKDAVDAKGKPVYQGIDTSFLVATLTAAIQELKAEFDLYKSIHP